MAKIKNKYFIEKKYLNIITSVLIFLLVFFIGRNYPDTLNQAVVLTEEYSSLIVAIATVLLVIATILLVRVTRNQNKPWLYFYFKKEYRPSMEFTENGNAMPRLPPQLCVKNVGTGPAIEIEFKIEQIKIPLNALSPQEEININEIHSDILGTSKKIEIIDIKYTDLNKSCSQDDFTLQT